jgi:hypothetical protein
MIKFYLNVLSFISGFLMAVLLSNCGRQITVNNGLEMVPGPQGSTGPQGATGKAGNSLVSTTMAAMPSQCPNGGNILIMAQDTEELGVWSPKDLDQTSVVICNGLTGAQGATGATGAQGIAGTNSTPVSTVQFCKGYQTNYPGTFPEFGLVISGAIYAVYWDGSNAWLAEVIPGYYASTSTSAPCNFTVNVNGTVSN